MCAKAKPNGPTNIEIIKFQKVRLNLVDFLQVFYDFSCLKNVNDKQDLKCPDMPFSIRSLPGQTK